MPARQCPTPQRDRLGPAGIRFFEWGIVAVVACAVVAAMLLSACGGGDAGESEEPSVLPAATEGSKSTATLIATVETTEEPEPPPATPTRTPVPGPPYTTYIISEYVPYPMRTDHLVQSSDLIVVGRVVEVLPARWTTADGVRPANPFGTDYSIITPAVLEIEEVLFDRDGLDLVGARVIVATEGGSIGDDSVESERPLEAGTRIFSVLSPYRNRSGEPMTHVEEPMWYPHTRYTLTDYGVAVPHIAIWETRQTDELLDGIRAYVAGEPWRRPEQYGQCMPEDVPLSLARFIGAFNMGDGEGLGLLFPFTEHPGEIVEPHAAGGMQVFYGYAMAGETPDAVVYDGRKGTLIEHLLQRYEANERWYAQDFVFSENLDPALGMPHVTHGTFQFIREADDLPAVTMLAEVWFNCLDGSILYVRGWQEQAGVATASMIGSDYDVFPSWPEWMPDELFQRTTVNGTRWRPVELEGQAVDAPLTPYLNLSGGYAFGDAGNHLFSVRAKSLAEGHIALDQIEPWQGYRDGVTRLHLRSWFLATLQDVSTYRIVDGRLVFRNAAHEVIMVLVKDL